MKSRLSLLAVLTLGLGLGGCQDNLLPVEFFGFCGFPDTGTCVAPAGTCSTYQNGNLYLFYENGWDVLYMVAEFHNQRPDNSDASSGRVNTANARITEYSYKFTASPPVALTSRTVPFLTTPIPANGTATIYVPVLPFETVAELLAAPGYVGTISVEITPRGHFGDGTTFEVKGITAPVNVYTGVPAAETCPDPTKTPVACPNVNQTHSSSCG